MPGDIGFPTKPQLAAEMIERALAAGVPFRWVAAGVATAASTHNVSAKVTVWPIIELARYFTGSVRNRSLEGIKGGSAIIAVEVCCPSSIRRKSPMALVMFSLNFAPA